MIKKVFLGVLFSILFLAANSQVNAIEKIVNSTEVLHEFFEMKDNIPEDVLNITGGVISVPKMLNAGFVVGGKRGKGITLVKNEYGSWSNPVFISLTGEVLASRSAYNLNVYRTA